ncbi:Hypothetical_protein [Hexamita inflata]|uniref:Hypothetical_protein n=1 Tax=Hexamita inflata TaxID=28002 RepID=A0AA86U4A2_9EUKA|nr:Hypothetical protein HINF_LOCUS29565 [Hexamita inflata]
MTIVICLRFSCIRIIQFDFGYFYIEQCTNQNSGIVVNDYSALMNSDQTENRLISSIQRLLQLTSCDPPYVICAVMTLSDRMYNQLLCQLSFDFNTELRCIHQLFVEISKKHLYVPQRPLYKSPDSQQKPTSEQECWKDPQLTHVQRTERQAYKVPLSQYKQQFSDTVKSIMMEFEHTAEQMTEKQMCQFLTTYFKTHIQRFFWEKVQKSIPYKTRYQLQQYFWKSFVKCQYEEMSEDDKLKLLDLTRDLPNSKPSEIVDVFFDKSGNESYFRRKVLMFVQYLQRVGK